MVKAVSTVICWFLFLGLASGQTDAVARLRETGKTLLDKNVPDSVKQKNATKFLADFESEILAAGTDWVTPESLPFVSRLVSDDKHTEVFTWALKRAEDSYFNYGIVWSKDRKTGEAKTFRLDDKSETLKNTEVKNLGRTSWLGCVYYAMVDISKGNKRMFLLLGYGGGSPQIRRKVAEILTFNNVGEVQFGAPIFQTPKRNFNRVVLEYNAKASVSLKYYPEANMIVYDFLAPMSDTYIGNPAFYGPVGSYDGFRLKGGKFIFMKDVDARNPTENRGNRAKAVEKKLPPR